MNRVKVWAYSVVVAGVAVAALRSELLARRAEAIAALDARLAAGAAQVVATTRAVAREAAAAAALTARDEQLVEALHPKEPPPAGKLLPRKRPKNAAPLPPAPDDEAREAALRGAARAALANAEKTFGFTLPDGTVVTAGNREWLARRGQGGAAEGEAMGFLRGAIAGRAQRGWLRLNGALFYGASAPAGDGAGLVVLVPIDDAWVRRTGEAIGADVTVSAPDVKALSTLRGDAAQPFTAWTFGAGGATDVGRAGPAAVALGPLSLPRLPQPWGAPAAYRARGVPLEGVKSAFLVVAVPTAPAMGPLAASHWVALAIVAALLLAGVGVGFLVKASEAAPAVPDALLAAASRIERGDFAARAPKLAGRLGTLAAALNKAAELAGPAAAAASAAPEPFVARPLAPAPVAAFEPPPPAAAPAPPPAPAAGLLQTAARAAAPGMIEVDEETHWQQIFQDFLRTRASCGEPTEGLTYEKFRLKLEGNKAALVAKYACKSVKFQVYVKDGKAALKATPVK